MFGLTARWRFAVCVVSAPVIVLAGGCSSSAPSSNSSGPSSNSSGQQPTSQAASGDPSKPSAADITAVVNGQTITPQGKQTCSQGLTGGLPGFVLQAMPGGNLQQIYASLDGTGKVVKVTIKPDPTTEYSYPRRVVSGADTGDAQSTNDGKTYKITGNIAPTGTLNGGTAYPATVPFEINATCE